MTNPNAPLRFAVACVVATAALIVASLPMRNGAVSAAPPTPPASPVFVTNSGAAQAIPTAAQGTTLVSGDVGISGTPTVKLAAGSSVGIDGSVQVGNNVQTPLFVRDVDNGARNDYQTNMVLTFGNGDFVQLGEITVPPFKVFAVELLTAVALLPNNQRVRLTYFVDDQATIIQHFFAPTFVGTDFTQDVLSMSQPVRLYAKSPGGSYAIRVNATRFPSNQGTGSVQLSFSGYLVDE